MRFLVVDTAWCQIVDDASPGAAGRVLRPRQRYVEPRHRRRQFLGIRGAALSQGGLPIIALPSTAGGGTISRITASLRKGAGVVTTRGHVHWIVTEYG